jgi:hypothetical protein
MSKKLLESVEQFLRGSIPVDEFVDEYVDGWRAERDSDELLADDPTTSEKLSSIFCVVDLYNPDEDREEYEFDEARLRAEVQKLLEGV